MARSRATYLLNRLINNKLSSRELDELLANLGQDEMSPEYSDVLEDYFNALLSEQEKEEAPEVKEEKSTRKNRPDDKNRNMQFSIKYPQPATWLYGIKVPAFLFLGA